MSGAVLRALAAVAAVAAACHDETRLPGARTNVVADASIAGSDGGSSPSPPGTPELDAGAAPSPRPEEPDASLPRHTERLFCGFDGNRFTTYAFPSGELVRSFGVEEFRAFGALLGVDDVRGELFVESSAGCAGDALCAVDVFSADGADLVAPLRQIDASPYRISAIAPDHQNDTLVLLAHEVDASLNVLSRRAITVPRTASTLAAPLRQLELEPKHNRLVLDAARGELYVASPGSVDAYALDATGSAAPLRSMPYSSVAVSPLRSELYLTAADRLDTFSLPMADGDSPSRSLTGALGNTYIDEMNEELWSNVDGATHVYALTASGEAAPLRTLPVQYIQAVLPSRGEIVSRSSDTSIAFHSRTATDDVPLRVIAAAPIYGTDELLGVDPTRGEVLFGDDYGVVTVYALDAVDDAPPLRRFLPSPSLFPTTTWLDEEAGELIMSRGAHAAAYATTSQGRVGPSRELTTEELSFAVYERAYGGVLAITGANQLPVSNAEGLSASLLSRHGPLAPDEDYLVSGRSIEVRGLAYDGTHDEVILALQDCDFYQANPDSGPVLTDCHHEVRSYPRVDARGYRTVELPDEIVALDYDEDNDVLMLSGPARVFFLRLAESHDDAPDAGGIAADEVLELPAQGVFTYCD